MNRILTVGSGNIDFVQRLERMPEAGETVISEEFCSYIPGGKGGNAAIAAARLGADSLLCTRVGSDGNGARLKRFWEAEGIDCRFIPTDRSPSGLASIIVEADTGANRIIVFPGANINLCRSDVEDAMTCHPDAVLLGFELPDEAIYAAAEFAGQKNVPLFIDAGPAKTGLELAKLGHVTVFSPNENETEKYTGIAPNSAENCLRASIRLAGIVDCDFIVLKLGSRGAYIYDKKHYRTVPAYTVEAVDTTAAGDVFTVALTVEYLKSNDILRAVKFANAAAALTVSSAGASTSIPTLADVDAFLALRESSY